MKNTIFVLVSFFVYSNVISQTIPSKVHDITLDFIDKEFTSNLDTLEKFKKGQYYRIKIKKIDLSTYKVVINNSDSTISKPLDVSAFTGFNTDGLSKLLSNIVTSTNEALISSTELSMPGIKSNGFSAGSLFTGNPLAKVFVDAQQTFDSVKNELFAFKADLQDEIGGIYYGISRKKSECGDLINCKSLENFKYAINEKRKKLRKLNTTIIAKKRSYIDKCSRFYDNIQADTLIKAWHTSNIGNYDSLLKAVNLSLELIEYSKVAKIYDDISRSTSIKVTTFTSLPLQFSKDQTLLSIDIKPWKDSSNAQSYSTEISFPVYRKSYFAVGTGVYLSGMNDHAYSVSGAQIIDSVTSYSLVQENTSNRELGLAIQLHVGRKFGPNGKLGAHGTFGTGFSFTKSIKPRLQYGGGFSFGDQHRLTINGGGTVGYVDRLSNAFSVGEDFEYSAKPVNVLVSQIKTSWYLSFGYVFLF